jgi:peptide chain release factor 1
MFEKLQEVEDRYEDLAARLGDPTIVNDQREYQHVAKTHSDLTEIVTKWREYKEARKQLADTEAMLHDKLDDEMHELAQMEFDELKETIAAQEEQLKVLLLPRDPNDEKDVIVEIRAGTGGEEAALFAGDLLRMYTRYAERRRWKAELLNTDPTGIGGFKEAVIEIKGQGAYSALKFEGGVHRVQRVPATESSGRIHTSAATVAVMPEAEEVEVEVNPDDIQIDTFRSSSAGGQNVQKNETAIRITHRPSGIVVKCQDERSQLQNKLRAMTMLRSHLLDREIQAQHDAESQTRKLMVGSGDRSEKIRTYNFPQSRVTDHRINFTIYKMDAIMDGDIQELIDRLNSADQAEKLQSSAV